MELHDISTKNESQVALESTNETAGETQKYRGEEQHAKPCKRLYQIQLGSLGQNSCGKLQYQFLCHGWNGEWTLMIHISWYGSTPPWLWSGLYKESYSWEDEGRLFHGSIYIISRGKPLWYWWYKRDTKLVNCHKVTFCEWVIPHKWIHGRCHKKGFLIVPRSHNAGQQVITQSTSNLHHKNTYQFICAIKKTSELVTSNDCITMICKSFKYFMLISEYSGRLFYRISTLATDLFSFRILAMNTRVSREPNSIITSLSLGPQSN